jgi:hypothetical protein
MNYEIVLNSPTGLKKKLVRVYLERDGEHRVIQRRVRQEVDVEGYIETRFDDLWNDAEPLPEHQWRSAAEESFMSLYREMAWAAVQAARAENSEITDVTAAMEELISQSGQSDAYNRLRVMASRSSARDRDAFFVAVSFIVLRRMLADNSA